MHKILKTIIKKLDKVRRQFFWGEITGGEENMRRMHTVRWDFICSSKEKGGLSLTKIESRNAVLLAKWWWKFQSDKDKQCLQFIFNKYGNDFIYQPEDKPKNMSLMFKDIWQCRENSSASPWISHKMFKWKVGQGTKIKFWKDVWCSNAEIKVIFSRLYSIARYKDISVADMKKRWQDEHEQLWRRNLRGWEIDSAKEQGSLVENINLNHNADNMEWLGNNG